MRRHWCAMSSAASKTSPGATGAHRVTGARIWLGALSHLSAEHFREHFAIAVQGSIAAGATLAIEVSDDLDDPHAPNVRLESVDLDE